jgi:hypothetical protein
MSKRHVKLAQCLPYCQSCKTPDPTHQIYPWSTQNHEAVPKTSPHPFQRGRKVSQLNLLVAYEAEHYPIDPPDPIDAIKFRMDQQVLKPKDLEPMIGRRNWVYEVLCRFNCVVRKLIT